MSGWAAQRNNLAPPKPLGGQHRETMPLFQHVRRYPDGQDWLHHVERNGVIHGVAASARPAALRRGKVAGAEGAIVEVHHLGAPSNQGPSSQLGPAFGRMVELDNVAVDSRAHHAQVVPGGEDGCAPQQHADVHHRCLAQPLVDLGRIEQVKFGVLDDSFDHVIALLLGSGHGCLLRGAESDAGTCSRARAGR